MTRFLLLVAIGFSCAAHAMTDAERDQLREAARAEYPSKAPQGTGALLARLGNARDIAALDEAIALHNLRLLRSLMDSWNTSKPPPEFEARVLANFEDREVAAILIDRLYEYHDPALFEALYRDVAATARLRAERRRGCRAHIAQYQQLMPVTSGAVGAAAAAAPAIQAQAVTPGRAVTRGGFSLGGATQRYSRAGESMIGWSYVCDRGEPDSMRLDLDGRPTAQDGHRTREAAAVEAIARNEIPGTEARLAPLFHDLSLYPLPDWRDVSLTGEPPPFRTAHPPPAFPDLFARRLYAPPVAPTLEVLKELVPMDFAYSSRMMAMRGNAVQMDRETWSAIVAIHRALVPADAVEATRALGTSIERAAAIQDASERRDYLRQLIPYLGPVLPQAQIDLAALKARVLERASYDAVPDMSRMFTQVEAENRSLREPSAASLTRFVDNPYWRRLYDYLLANGADPNQPVAETVQPPLLAAVYRNEAAANLFLDRGADIRIRDSVGKTALHAACDWVNVRVDRSAIAARLIKMGADVNAVAERWGEQVPLHLAASGSATCVKLLLAGKAKVDVPDRSGDTPLAWAARNNNMEATRLLLDAGADPNHENREGVSPYMWGYDKPEMHALLESRGGRLTMAQMAMRAKAKAMMPFYYSH